MGVTHRERAGIGTYDGKRRLLSTPAPERTETSIRSARNVSAEGAPRHSAVLPRLPRRDVVVGQVRTLIRAIRDGDEARVEHAVLQLSRSKRYLAPLTFAIGALVMLFQGVKLLFSDWRLSLLQVLPAMWIWAAMLDLKLHVFKRRELRVWDGSLAVALVIAIVLLTVACYYLNAVFAFAISSPGKPQIRSAFTRSRGRLDVILTVGLIIGIALGISIIVTPRWGLWWFAFSLSVVIGVMMLTYVAIPSRLIGMKAIGSPRDKLTATVVGGAIGAIVCTPPYIVGRVGILLLGSRLFVLGVILISLGFTLQAGATGAVKAIKMSAKLVAGNVAHPEEPATDASTTDAALDQPAPADTLGRGTTIRIGTSPAADDTAAPTAVNDAALTAGAGRYWCRRYWCRRHWCQRHEPRRP